MKPTPLNELDKFRVVYNRERYRQEIAEGIYLLMQRQGVSRSTLATLLGVTRGRISQILSGDDNLQADTIADVLLALGRTPHLSLGIDFDEARTPIDEATEPDKNHSFTLETTYGAQAVFVEETTSDIKVQGREFGSNGETHYELVPTYKAGNAARHARFVV